MWLGSGELVGMLEGGRDTWGIGGDPTYRGFILRRFEVLSSLKRAVLGGSLKSPFLPLCK